MMKSLLYDLLAPIHLQRALRQLRWLERKLPTPELRFAVPPAFRGRGHFKTMKIMQHGREILDLYELVLRQRPRRVVEIGTARGGTLYLWTQAAADDAVVVSIDLPDGPFGGGYPACRIPFYRAFARAGQSLELLRCDARAPGVPAQVTALLGGEGIDFLFIDADHTYDGISANFQLYAPLVRPGGVIALHDILPNPRDSSIEVWRFWRQLRQAMGSCGDVDAREIVGSPDKGRPLGIGVLRVPEEGVAAWLRRVPPHKPMEEAA